MVPGSVSGASSCIPAFDPDPQRGALRVNRVAHFEAGRTVDGMSKGLAAKAQANHRVERLRGVPEPVVQPGDLGALAADVAGNLTARPMAAVMEMATRRPLAEAMTRPAPLPELARDPFTRVLDASNRLPVRVDGNGLMELLGWSPGLLTTKTDGRWVVLRPDTSRQAAYRNDGRCSVSSQSRLRLSAGVVHNLGVRPGREVAVLLLAEHGAVALCHPAALLLGAPLALIQEAHHG
jgi:hypothetical protein